LKPLRSPPSTALHQQWSAQPCRRCWPLEVLSPTADAAGFQPRLDRRLGQPQCRVVLWRDRFTCAGASLGPLPWPGAIFCSIVVGRTAMLQGRSVLQAIRQRC